MWKRPDLELLPALLATGRILPPALCWTGLAGSWHDVRSIPDRNEGTPRQTPMSSAAADPSVRVFLAMRRVSKTW